MSHTWLAIGAAAPRVAGPHPPATAPMPPEAQTSLGFVLLTLLVLLLQFGPLLGLLAFDLSDNPLWAYIGVLRDVLVALLLVLACAHALDAPQRQSVGSPANSWALAIVIASAGASLVSDSSLSLVALNVRRLALLPLLFLTVGRLPLSRGQIERLLGLLVGTSLLAAGLALAERAIGDSLWTEWLSLDAYTAANGLDRFNKGSFEANGRYFSSDLHWLIGQTLRRAIGSYLEPTTLAAGMSAALALALARRARGHASTWLILVIIACGLLTISKGFLLYLLLLLAWRLVGLPTPSQVLLLSLVAVGASTLSVALGFNEGAFLHLAGVPSAISHLAEGHWLGTGLGELGNYSNDTSEVGTESGLGNAMAQVGVIAFLPLLWMRALALQTLERARSLADPGGPWLASWALFWTTSYVMSASSQGIGGNALGFLMLALYLHPNVCRPES